MAAPNSCSAANYLPLSYDGVVRRYCEDQRCPILVAFGNSRPDRALFEAVRPGGLRVLVCHRAVFRKRKDKTFVVRKLCRSGYQVEWTPEEFMVVADQHADNREQTLMPVLATDMTFQNILDSPLLAERYPCLAAGGRIASATRTGSERPDGLIRAASFALRWRSGMVT